MTDFVRRNIDIFWALTLAALLASAAGMILSLLVDLPGRVTFAFLLTGLLSIVATLICEEIKALQ